MKKESTNVSNLPLGSIGVTEIPSDIVDGEASPFNSYYSDTALCRECYGVFSMTFIPDSKCPFCGEYVSNSNIVVSLNGEKASLDRALELSKKLKEAKTAPVIKDEDIYEDEVL